MQQAQDNMWKSEQTTLWKIWFTFWMLAEIDTTYRNVHKGNICTTFSWKINNTICEIKSNLKVLIQKLLCYGILQLIFEWGFLQFQNIHRKQEVITQAYKRFSADFVE